VDVSLVDGATFTGKVVDLDGKPIADGNITVRFWPSRWGLRLEHWPVTTNKQGSYEVKALSPGHRYSVAAKADGYGRQSTRPFRVDHDVDNRLELAPLVLKMANLSVSGVVVDEDDKPVQGISISTSGSGQPPREVVRRDED